MKLSDFDYDLPPDRIAQTPAADREDARLLVHERGAARTSHARVRELGRWLRAGDLLVVNDTRVLPVRLHARRASGGRVELLLVERRTGVPFAWHALVQPSRRLRAGERLELAGGPWRARLGERSRQGDGSLPSEWPVEFEDAAGRPVATEEEGRELLETAGRMPLPPYVERPPEGVGASIGAVEALDRERYQTVYAAQPGAVAAPTAGLHLTQRLLGELEGRGVGLARVTLHVGPGTFQPVREDDVRRHRMHAERFELPSGTARAVRDCRRRGGRIVAVGTTSARALETCAGADGEVRPGSGKTELFIAPGYRFRAVDALLTNFHLPRSTLLMLVSAFAGRERILELYAEAVRRGYRFYSYGDAMLLC